VRKTFYGSSEKDVRSKIRKARRAYDAGQLAAAPSISVANYLDGWLARVVIQSVKPKTYESARLNVERVKRHVGRARLEALTPAAIQQLYGSLLESGLSRRSVEQVHEVLHRALRQAMQWGLLVRNPADAVSVPRPRSREMETLTEAELRQLFAATQEDRLHALWVLLGTTGLRIGEALALSWDDLDLEAGRLVVRRALQRQRNAGLVFVEPKSAQSRRTVYLASGTVDALRGRRELERRERQFAGGEWREHGLVFCTLTGGPLEHSTVTYGFQKALRSAGLRRIRIHDLRHTAATLLLKNGVHPKVVQEFLGHSSITLTLETYSHVVPSLHVEVAARMQGIFEPNGANGSKLAATPPQLVGEEED
jgi:integrase